MRSHLRELLTQAIEKTAKGGELNSTDLPPLLLEPPKQREFGDLTTNIAMLWAQKAKKPPRIIAEMVLKNIEDPHSLLARKEIAGRGFLNFTFSSQFYYQRLRELAEERTALQISVEAGKCKSSSPVCQSDRSPSCRLRTCGCHRGRLGALAQGRRFRCRARILGQ